MQQPPQQPTTSMPRLSRFLTKSSPSCSMGEEQGMDTWVARFKYEFPWAVEFEKLEANHPDRLHFKNLRSTGSYGVYMAGDNQEATVAEQRERPAMLLQDLVLQKPRQAIRSRR